MIYSSIRNSWKAFSIANIGLLMLLWLYMPSYASELKDIRIGEYNSFTRIVFELNKPRPNPAIKIYNNNKIIVIFQNTKVNLIRKIPVNRSPHIERIQLWQHNTSFSALLALDYNYLRIESFQLGRPPRFAIDVFPLKKTQTEVIPPTATSLLNDKKKQLEKKPQPFGQEIKIHSGSRKSSKMIMDQQQNTPNPADKHDNKHYLKTDTNNSELSAQNISIQKPKEAQLEKLPEIELIPKNRLQFFLFVMLLVMIIIIILLLLVILLTKYRFAENKTSINFP